jgi:hypothetical protein
MCKSFLTAAAAVVAVLAAVPAQADEAPAVAPADLDEGGKHFEAITTRIEILGLSMPTKRDARLTAERLFGPRGKLAPDFLVKD